MSHRLGVLTMCLASLLASSSAFSQCAGCNADVNRADRAEVNRAERAERADRHDRAERPDRAERSSADRTDHHDHDHDRPERSSAPAKADSAKAEAKPDVRNMPGLTLSKSELQARERAADAKTNAAFHEEASSALQSMATDASKKEAALAEKVSAQDKAMAINEANEFNAAKESVGEMVGQTDIMPGVGDNPIETAKDAADLSKNTADALSHFDQVKAHRDAQNREVDGTAQDDRNELRDATHNREGLERLAKEQGEAATREHAKAEQAEAEAQAAADAAEARDRAAAEKAKAERDQAAAKHETPAN